MSQCEDGDRAGRHLGQPGVDDARDARPLRRERRERALPRGRSRCPGQPAATQSSSAPVSAAITAAWAICATVLPELMTAAGLSA